MLLLHNEVLIPRIGVPAAARRDSLMRNLGRRTACSSTADRRTGSVPIVFAMMNSEGTRNLTRPGSRILDAIDKGRAVGPKLETAFLSILNRMPNAEERSLPTRPSPAIGADGSRTSSGAGSHARIPFIQ